MSTRRKIYEKARNIVRNNLEKQLFSVKVSAKTAPYIIKAYNLYQKQALIRRGQMMTLVAARNRVLPVVKTI